MDRVLRLDSFASLLVQRPNAAVHAVGLAVEHTDLSTAKERRRQRNERRLELAASRKLLRDEDSLEAKPRKRSDPSLANLTRMGMQWYTLRVFTNNEAESMEALRGTLQEEFPDAKFELWSPIVPTETTVRGKSRFAMKAMLRGHVFLRCVLDAPVYRHVLNERSVFCFVGAFPYKTKAGYDSKMMKGGYPDTYLPAPVPSYQIDALRDEAAAKERDFNLLQQKKKEEAEEKAVLEESDRPDHSSGKKNTDLRVGDVVAVASGPYQDFQGTILEFLPAGKAKVVLPVFGTDTEIDVNLDDLVAEGEEQT